MKESAKNTIGLIGLGLMGSAIAERLLQVGYTVIGFDISESARISAAKLGVNLVNSVQAVAENVRVIWLMIPAGKVATIVQELYPLIQERDIIIDGGNSNFHDSVEHAKLFAQKNSYFLDCGTSGGLEGRTLGFCLMIGGDKQAFETVEHFFKAVAAPNGYQYIGPSGAGHYVKMVHNGIEYALLQAYAEGFYVLNSGSYPALDLAAIAELWSHGSIIRSYILELVARVLARNPDFTSISGKVDATGMGAWTVQEAQRHQIPVRLIKEALHIREKSQKTGGDFATKLVALLRHEFGGHIYYSKNKQNRRLYGAINKSYGSS